MVTDLIQRIQDKNALSDDLISGKRTDHAGIRRYDPIVSHHEILIRAQGDRVKVLHKQFKLFSAILNDK